MAFRPKNVPTPSPTTPAPPTTKPIKRAVLPPDAAGAGAGAPRAGPGPAASGGRASPGAGGGPSIRLSAGTSTLAGPLLSPPSFTVAVQVTWPGALASIAISPGSTGI